MCLPPLMIFSAGVRRQPTAPNTRVALADAQLALPMHLILVPSSQVHGKTQHTWNRGEMGAVDIGEVWRGEVHVAHLDANCICLRTGAVGARSAVQ